MLKTAHKLINPFAFFDSAITNAYLSAQTKWGADSNSQVMSS
jgi:hypothetical protein